MTQTYFRSFLRSLQGVVSKAVLILGFIGLSFPPLVVAHGIIEHTSTRTLLVKRIDVRSRAHVPVRDTHRTESRTSSTQALVGPYHTPRRHIHRQILPGRGITRLAVLPRDCEEVSGEEATFYCDGVYYRAYYQGNDVVYVREADLE